MFQSLVKNARVPTKPYSTQVYQESWVAMGLIGFITYEIKQVKALKASSFAPAHGHLCFLVCLFVTLFICFGS
uniref:Uncharacterized protein n=1 Tax=Ursus maritimus TaxID=29073 RepID=A0A452SXC5_URSMA